MSYAPTTRRVRAPHDGPRHHRIAMETDEPGLPHVVKQSIAGGDEVVVAWLRTLADEIEKRNR